MCGQAMTAGPTSKSPMPRERQSPPGQTLRGPYPVELMAGPLPDHHDKLSDQKTSIEGAASIKKLVHMNL